MLGLDASSRALSRFVPLPSLESIIVIMSVQQFKLTLARIKERFTQLQTATRATRLSAEDTAHLLHPFLACEPQAQRQLLIRATGKQYLSWDDLLQYLEEDLSVRQAAKKLQHEPPSASEIHDRHCGEFSRLLHAVRLKETNAIQTILPLPEPAHYLICLEKQLLCYDAERCQIVGAMELGYSRVEQKLWEKEEQRQQLRSREQRLQVEEGADKVELQVEMGPHAKVGGSKGRGSMLGSHLKSSVRGSSMSSEKSNDRIVLRKFNTESGDQKKRSKSSVIKLKNDDVKKVFELFEQASITNSLAIAHAFNDARTNFHKSIVLDRSILEKEPRAAGMELSAAHIHHDYHRELAQMRLTNKQLGRVRLGNSLDVQRRPKQPFQPPTNVRQPRRTNGSALQMQGRVLGIVSVSLLDNLLLVSLFNRQVRLLRLKKTLNRITQQCIFERSFREVVTFVLLYRSPNSRELKAVFAMQKGGRTQVGVWSVSETELGNRSYVQEMNFSGRCQSVLPLGVTVFNESGRLEVVEVGCAVGDKQERMGMSVQLTNSDSNYRVSISQLRAHRNQLLFFLGCAHGYAYQVDRYTGQIKYQVRVTQSPVLDLALVKDDSELLLLFGNGNMALLSSLHLQRLFLYQAYGDISPDTRLLIAPTSIFYLYSARNISAHSLSDNQQKLFNNVKPIKVLQARSRLKQRQPKASSIGSGKVVRVVSGSGGEGECLSLICEHGEIIVLDSHLQYVGSYFLLQAASLIDLVVSQALQFLAVLLDDYSLQVVNLYTQALLFSFPAPPRPEIYAPSPYLHTLHFFDSTSPSFFAVVTGALTVQHYSEKGSQMSATDLKVSCAGVQPSGPMIFLGEELALAAGCEVVVLHRKSYNRKCVVKVSSSSVVRLHRATGNSLCGLDSSNCVFLVDLSLRQCRLLCSPHSSPCESVLFSPTILLRHSDSQWRLRQFEPFGEWLLGVDGERELLGVVGSRVVRVSRSSGRLAVLQLPSLLFRQFSL